MKAVSSSSSENDLDSSDAEVTFDNADLNGNVELLSSVRLQQREIRNQSKDIFNRLRSIATDAAFVQRVKEEYSELPRVPNARCGLWYCPVDEGVIPGYFKSTDGHTNNYKFSLRRPNLHILPIIQKHDGVILVDSTRRGKLFPDALSKTVPIWCAVINTALDLPLPDGQESWLFTPPRAVSPSEHAVIMSLISGFADSLRQSALLLPKLSKPLRPFWVHPHSTYFPSIPPVTERAFHPVICVSASRRVERAEDGRVQDWGAGWGYVQGAGDDEESWSMGLTPGVYWANKAPLDACSRAELLSLVRTLVEHQGTGRSNAPEPSGIGAVDSLISVGQHPLRLHTDGVLHITILASTVLPTRDDQRCLFFALPPAFKTAQAEFYAHVLPAALTAAKKALDEGKCIVVADDTRNGEWLAPLALVLLQTFFDDNGRLLLPAPETATSSIPSVLALLTVDKKSLARRLQWIVQSRPGVNPSRAQLKAVNIWFMSPPKNARTRQARA